MAVGFILTAICSFNLPYKYHILKQHQCNCQFFQIPIFPYLFYDFSAVRLTFHIFLL